MTGADATQWRVLPAPFSRYEVSDTGAVRSRPHCGKRGCIKSYNQAGRLLRQGKGGRANNYARVHLHGLASIVGDRRRRRHAYVHHLVAEAFLGPKPSPAHVVCHRNDNGRDNRAANLYWGTRDDNETDRHVNSLDLAAMESAPF